MMTPTDSLDLIPGRRRWLIPTIPHCALHLKERTRRWREWRAGDWWLVARVVAPPVWHGWRSADISLALRHRPAWSDWSPRASEWANKPIGSAMDVKEKRKPVEAAETKTTKYKSNSQITASGLFYNSWRGRKSLALSVMTDNRATKSCNKYNVCLWVIYCSQEGRRPAHPDDFQPHVHGSVLQLQMLCITDVVL